jgi:VIT1/CCC1 family predicted Fe2+/Mn2+ transporter
MQTESNSPNDSICEHNGRFKSYGTLRDCYARRDADAVIAEHCYRMNPDGHPGGASDYVKAIVFGGLDGIITTFAIVAAAAGSNAGPKAVLIFGFANVLADGFSMGFGEFISGNAERDFALSERAREEWEVDVHPEMEKKEMVAVYVTKGISEEDAITMVDIISKDKKIFVDFMMVDELSILCDVAAEWESAKQGLVMFISFICFGMLPLLAYLGGKGRGTDYVFGISTAIVSMGLLLLGAVKGKLTSMSIPKAAAMMLLNGAISGGASYGVGVFVEHIVGTAAE